MLSKIQYSSFFRGNAGNNFWLDAIRNMSQMFLSTNWIMDQNIKSTEAFPLHICGFNWDFVLHAGDTSHTAWRSTENRPATWWKPTRRYKYSVLKLLFGWIIAIWLCNTFLSLLFLLVSRSLGAELSGSADQQRSPPADNRPQKAKPLHLFARKVSQSATQQHCTTL